MTVHSWRDPHIVRSSKSLLKALFITSGIFLSVGVMFHIAGVLSIFTLTTKTTDTFQAGLRQDLAQLITAGDAITTNPELITQLLARDPKKLLTVLHSEQSTRSIGSLSVADISGITIGSTLPQGQSGDRIFLTTALGRIVAQGQSAVSIEQSGFDNGLALTTGQPITADGSMLGGLFANTAMDDSYAARFKKTYLPDDVEVVFYTKDFGVYGDSFSDPETRQRIKAYFSTGSDWIQNGTSKKTIFFSTGQYYLIDNIVFPGLDQSPGGVLLFIPRQDLSGIAKTGIALITIFIFIILALYRHLRSRGEERGWRYYLLLSVMTVPVVVLAYLVLTIEDSGFFNLKHIPYVLSNTTVRLEPETGVYDLNFAQHFSIVVDPSSEPMSAVQVGILFDPDAVEIKMLDTTQSNCKHIITNTIDAQVGRADFSCTIMSTSETVEQLAIADIVVKPKRPGVFILSFDNNTTAVFTHDGLDTSVLQLAQASSYQVDTFDSDQVGPLVIFSPTHPNQSRWYNTTKARFVWTGKPDAVYLYAFDNTPDTIPPKTQAIQGSTLTIPIPGDGSYFFHLKDVATGQVSHYRIQSDSSSPTITTLKVSADTIVAGDVVRFAFAAEDAGSGVQQKYYLDLGDHLFLPVGSQVFIPFLKASNQTIVLRVYDAAGNYSEKSQTIHVQPAY